MSETDDVIAHIGALVAATIDGGLPQGMALLVQGGLARRQWLPGADVDLVLLRDDAIAVDTVDIGPLVATLWDEGKKPSLATRTVSELPSLFDTVDGKDGHAAMALLEARPVIGDVAWAKATLRTLRSSLGRRRRRRLLSARLDEAIARRARSLFSPSLTEPDPKEGTGGLRDAHLAMWAGLCVSGVDVGDDDALSALLTAGTLSPSEVQALRHAIAELLRIRHALHSVAPNEKRLHAEVAERAGAFLEMHASAELRAGEAVVRRAVAAMRLCAVTCDDVIVRLLGDETPAPFKQRPKSLPSLAQMLAQQEPSRVPGPLTAALERGALGEALPDVARLLGRVKHDGIHTFCTDAHLARCGDIALAIVGNSNSLGELSLPAPLVPVLRRIEQPVVVAAAALLHDIGKGLPGDHSVLGDDIARRELTALGFDDDVIDDVCFIVRHHLLLSTAAQRSDLGDPKVIADLSSIIAEPARLDVLAIVTWCDWCAVGPGVATSWKGRLLADCTEAVREALLQPELQAKDAAAVRARAKELLQGVSADVVDSFVDGARVPWLRGRTAAALRGDATAYAALHRQGGVVIDREPPQRAWVLTDDRVGLLADLAAAFAQEGASVLDARLDVRSDGRAFDRFVFDDGRANPMTKEACALLETALNDAIDGTVRTPSRRAPKTQLPVRVRFLDDGEADRVVVEVRGPDRRALLHDLARVFAAHDLTISLARLHTEGPRVTDVFTATGKSIDRKALKAALEDAMLPG